MNQHGAGGWKVQGTHHCSRWPCRGLNSSNGSRSVSETRSFLGGSLQGGNHNMALYLLLILMCNVPSKHLRGYKDRLTWEGDYPTAAGLGCDLSQRFACSLFPGTHPLWLCWRVGSRPLSGGQWPWSAARKHQVSTQINFSLCS